MLDSIADGVFFFLAVIIMAIVAIRLGAFIATITLGRFGRSDVPRVLLRTTQFFAGVSAISLAISFIVTFVSRAR
jgi:hypothetical protein